MSARPTTAFYCVSSGEYFLGAVGLINSLRLHGHTEPIYLLDCGLEPEQRRLLAGEVKLVDAPDDTPPYLLKTIAPLAHPAEVMVLIDVDMIVTRPLGELIERARDGHVVAFENFEDRHVPEWGPLLDLGQIRRQPYVCSGFVAMGREPGDRILRLLDDRQRGVDFGRSYFSVNVLEEPLPDYPFLYLDQDVLNAILAGPIDAETTLALPCGLSATTPFSGLRITDVRRMRCARNDGSEPYLLHHILPGKPWLQPMPEGIYSRLLRRALVGDGLAIQVPAEMVPVRLREGAGPALARRSADLWLSARLSAGLWRARARRRAGMLRGARS